MNAYKMREDFEAWRKKYTLYKENKYYSRTVDKAEYDDLETQSSWLAYQVATAESTAKIAQMQARIDELEDRHKRDGDEYHAMHCALMDALAKVKDVK